MAPPAVPKEMKAVSLLHAFTVHMNSSLSTHPFHLSCFTQAFKVANQVANADAKQAADTDSLSKDPSPLMQRKLADQARRSGSDNTDPSAKV